MAPLVSMRRVQERLETVQHLPVELVTVADGKDSLTINHENQYLNIKWRYKLG